MLRGSIPDEIGYLSELKELYLNANELSGTIPYSIGTLTQLTDLNFNFHKFNPSNTIADASPATLMNLDHSLS